MLAYAFGELIDHILAKAGVGAGGGPGGPGGGGGAAGRAAASSMEPMSQATPPSPLPSCGLLTPR
jgi:hypothetical protein